MRVAIDWDLCIGSGLCEATAGGAFALVAVEDGWRAVLADATADDAALLAAARACPTMAIRLWEGERGVYPYERE